MLSKIFSVVLNLIRKIYYLNYFASIKVKGINIKFSKGGRIQEPSKMILGNNIYIGRDFKINANKGIKMGSNIMIGPNLVIETDNHTFNKVGIPMFQYSNIKVGNGIIIEDDVWIGANVVLLPDVLIGEGCIIGAGSIVTKSIPPYCIAVGNPCRPIKYRFIKEDLEIHLKLVNSQYHLDEILSNYENLN